MARCLKFLEDTQYVTYEEVYKSELMEGVSREPEERPKKEKGWKEVVYLRQIEDGQLRGSIKKILSKYSDMLVGQLRTVAATEHRIELKEGKQTAHQMPWRKGI